MTLTARSSQRICLSPTKFPRSNILATKSSSCRTTTSISRLLTRAIYRWLNLFFGNAWLRHRLEGVLDKIDKLLQRAASADIAELMSIWRAREPDDWSQHSKLYRALGERVL